MSFLDSILDVGGSAWSTLTGPGVAGGIARAAILGVMLNEVNKSINSENEQTDAAQSDTADYGVREQVDPNTESSIPLVYGQAFIGGNITDAALTNDNQTMWYCITLCERTGVKLSDNQQSQIAFQEIYWNRNRIIFQSDGVTAAAFVDDDGVTSDSINGLIRFYPFSGNSTLPIKITGQASGNTTAAYSLFPNWTANHMMNDLIFCLVRVDYSAEKQVTGLGTMEFKLNNSMTLTGDCVYDYMTNERYGAGITAEEIRAE